MHADWQETATAIGTVAVAIAAIGVTAYGEWPVVSQPEYVRWHSAAVRAEDSVPRWDEATDAMCWTARTDESGEVTGGQGEDAVLRMVLYRAGTPVQLPPGHLPLFTPVPLFTPPGARGESEV